MTQQTKIGKVATTISTNDKGQTQVIYHSTPVVTFDDKVIILNTGGWRTATTKTRMNQTSHTFKLDFVVYQKDFDWFVVRKIKGTEYDYDWKNPIPFDEHTLTLKR